MGSDSMHRSLASLLILCLWYWFILSMSNISVVFLYSTVRTCSDIFYYWWALGKFFDSGYCEWYHSEHSRACLLRNMHGIPGPHVTWILPKSVFQSGLHPLTHPLLTLSGALDPHKPLGRLSHPPLLFWWECVWARLVKAAYFLWGGWGLISLPAWEIKEIQYL